MVGCGQQQGRIGTQAATESGDKELTDDWAPGRGGDSSLLGACPGESYRETGRRRARGADFGRLALVVSERERWG